MTVQLIEKFKQFDAYAKTLEDFRVKTASGAAITLTGALTMIILFISELNLYMSPNISEELFVDTSMGHKLRINLDIIVPTISCNYLVLDAMDSSGEQHLQIDHNIYKRRLDLSGQPIEEPKKEEIVTSTSVKTAEDAKEQTNITCGSCYGAAFNDSQCCNTCDDVKEAYRLRRWALPDLATIEQCKNDKSAGKSSLAFKEGCQIYGYMEVNRVGGSFHIAPGQSFTINHVHVHDVQPYSSSAFNTTHIIKHLSFGTDIQSANTAPLDGIKGLAKEAPEHAGDMGQIRMHYHQACTTIPARALLDTNTLYYDQYGHGDLTLWPISPSPYTPELHTIYVTLSPTYQYCKLKKS